MIVVYFSLFFDDTQSSNNILYCGLGLVYGV